MIHDYRWYKTLHATVARWPGMLDAIFMGENGENGEATTTATARH